MKQMDKELNKLKENIKKSRIDLIRIIEKAWPDYLKNDDVLRISEKLDELINRYNAYLKELTTKF